MSVVEAPVRDEHEFYPVHEEDNVPIRPEHDRQTRLLINVLEGRFPDYWVLGEVCMYWERDNYQRYRAPDVLVAAGPRHGHDVFLAWSDGAALLAIEVGSKSTFRVDEGPKVEDYLLKLGVQEYLYFWPDPDPRKRRVRYWRLVTGTPAEIEPDREGRWESLALGIAFGVSDEGRLRAYEFDGRLIPGPNELREQVATERRRATLETLRAEQERDRAEQERQRADELEQELTRLREQLRMVRGETPEGVVRWQVEQHG